MTSYERGLRTDGLTATNSGEANPDFVPSLIHVQSVAAEDIPFNPGSNTEV